MSLRQVPWEKAFRLGRRSLLVLRPAGTHFGHLNLEIMQAVATARRNGSWLYLIEPRTVVNRTCFDLEMPGVRRLPNLGLLDRLLDGYADRETERQQRRHAALQKLSRAPANREKQRERRQLGLPPDAALLDTEYRLRIALRRHRLNRQSRRFGAELERLDAQLDRRPKAKSARAKKRHAARREQWKRRRLELRAEKKRIDTLIEGYGSQFLRTCQRDPLDPTRFWTWPIERYLGRRRERREAAEQRLFKLLVAGQGTSYHRRRLVAETPPMRLRERDTARLAALAERLGIAPDARIVTLHVREGGYKSGNKEAVTLPNGEIQPPRNEDTRNNTIENYLPAIRYLTEAGYTVVRLGDPSMTPLSLPSVVDLATSPEHIPALDYFCIARSAFFVGSDSGPMIIPYMTGVPMLLANVTHIAVSWPVGARDLLVPKYVRTLAEDRFLSLRETCGRDHLENFRAEGMYDYVELTPEDLVQSMREMERRVDTAELPLETALQRRYREAVGTWLRPEGWLLPHYFRKWGEDDGFLGHGALAQFVVERDAARGAWSPANVPPRSDIAGDRLAVTGIAERGKPPDAP